MGRWVGETRREPRGARVTQVNNIYGVVGFGSLVRTNGYATVESSDAVSPLFTYGGSGQQVRGT
jgi:hypothetical protein